MDILAECYLNECIAEKIAERIRRQTRVIHKYVFGRDRVLHELLRRGRENPSDKMLGIIDYEVGPARTYIDRNVEVNHKLFGDKILLGKLRKLNNVFAVVFDPNPEEVLNIKDEAIKRKLKSRNACKTLGTLNLQDKTDDIVIQIVEALDKLI